MPITPKNWLNTPNTSTPLSADALEDLELRLSEYADSFSGEDGRTVLNGSGAPSSGIGLDGDFYLDTSAWDIYGPKNESWGSPTTLIGPQGDQGSQGIQGETGPEGADGAEGADGRTVLNGIGAPSAGLGNEDDFYIDTTDWDIYGPKSGGSWGSATSLIGPQGEQGPQGESDTTSYESWVTGSDSGYNGARMLMTLPSNYDWQGGIYDRTSDPQVVTPNSGDFPFPILFVGSTDPTIISDNSGPGNSVVMGDLWWNPEGVFLNSYPIGTFQMWDGSAWTPNYDNS